MTHKNSEIFKKTTNRSIKAVFLIQISYCFVLFQAVGFSFTHWSPKPEHIAFNPLWCLQWVTENNYQYFLNTTFALLLLSSIILILNYSSRTIRIILFLSFTLIVAVMNSPAKIHHSSHFIIYCSFLLIFLPNNKKCRQRESQLKTLNTIFTIQVIMASAYSLSGFWKLVGAIEQHLQGLLSAFSLNGFSTLVASKLIRNSDSSILGSFIIEHPKIGFSLFWAVIFLQLSFLLIIKHRKVRLFWAFSLILFHIGSILILNVPFKSNIFLLCIFFLFYDKQHNGILSNVKHNK